MKLKTSELIGSALDLAVAVAWNVELDEQGRHPALLFTRMEPVDVVAGALAD